MDENKVDPVESLDEDLDFELATDETTEEPETKPVTEKPKETSEQRVARLKRMLEREEKKLGKGDESSSKSTKSSEFDYGQLAFLAAKGVDTDEGIALAQTIMAETGKELKDVVSSKYFQAELKELKETQAASDALPKGSRRATTPARDTVEYYLAKGEMPPADQTQLRREYVNARAKKETEGSKFTSNPVVS